MEKTILVVGGTGMLGGPVVRRLLAQGYCVRVLSRMPDRARMLCPAEVEVVRGDVENARALESTCQGCYGVHINLRDERDPDLEARGVENIIAAAVASGVARISYLSGASVSAENCWFPGTRAKFRAENAIRASGLAYTVFRAAYFMETLDRFTSRAGKRAMHIGRQPYPYHWLAANDYARMVGQSYATGLGANTTLTIYGPQSLTMRQALEVYCSILCPDARIITLPLWVAGIIARLGRREDLQAALPFFHYSEKVREVGDPREANELLGAPATTLEQWCKNKVP